ncbi:MAG: MBL fold metallo-hydrolase [Planctomycetota bacterium]
MIENIPIQRCVHDGLTIEGYSRGAVQTAWRVNELKVLFDCGVQPWDFMGTDTLFITHAHLDHIAALPQYVSRRRMMKMEPPVIYLPDSAVDAAWDILQMYRRLDRGAMPCELVGLLPGDEHELSREHVVTALPTRHTIESVGFVVHQRRHKLKPEFRELAGHEIRDLKLAGTEVTSETRVPLFAYTGDTSPRGLDENDVFYKAKILIAEMTFVAPEHRREKIHKHGHMHIDDWTSRRERFENELIIAGHLSTRYTDDQIRRVVARRIPDRFDDRLKLWL